MKSKEFIKKLGFKNKDCMSAMSAWDECMNADKMLCIAKKQGINIRTLTLAKGLCAETVVHLMKDRRSVDAVYMSIAFGLGHITEDELKVYAYAAYAAITYAYDFAYSSYAFASDAAAAYAADAAADAADAADADVDNYYFAEKVNKIKCANICREIISFGSLNIVEKSS